MGEGREREVGEEWAWCLEEGKGQGDGSCKRIQGENKMGREKWKKGGKREAGEKWAGKEKGVSKRKEGRETVRIAGKRGKEGEV